MPPANDNIANAVVLAPSGGTLQGDNTGATLEAGEAALLYDSGAPAPAFHFGGGRSVWYQFTAPHTGVFVFETSPPTSGSQITDSIIHVINGSNFGTATCLAFNDDRPADTYSQVSVVLTSGQTVWINVDGYNGESTDFGGYNLADTAFGTFTLTWSPGPDNDNLADAIVINQVGGNVLQVSNIGASTQTNEQNFFDGRPSVWYRIECPGTGHVSLSALNVSGYRTVGGYCFKIDIRGPIVTDPPTITSLASEPFVGSVTQSTFPASSHPPYDDTGSWEPWYREWACNAGDVFYVRVSHSGLGAPMGTFTMRVTLRDWQEFAAAPGINNGSSTTSIVSTDWVRDTQYHKYDDAFVVYKGELDYTETFTVQPGLSGKYEMQIYSRYTSVTNVTNDDFNYIVRVNGNPVRIGISSFRNINNTAAWEGLTQEYMRGSELFGWSYTPAPVNHENGGPRYINLSAGDVVSVSCGSVQAHYPFNTALPPDRYVEVQKVRFTKAGAYDPLPSWKPTKHNLGSWDFNSYSNLVGRSLGNKLYIFDDVIQFKQDIGSPVRNQVLNVWAYELVDGAMEAEHGDDLPIDRSSPPADIFFATRTTNSSILWKDLTVLPNGDIYCLWFETTASGGFAGSANKRLVLKKFDAGSQSWSLITSNVSGHGSPSTTHYWNTPSIDNDGTDVYLVFGENRVANVYNTGGWWWRCMKYDTSANTLTELGTGQTAYLGATSPKTQAGEFDYPVRIRVSPGGVPYVIWGEWDPDKLFPYGVSPYKTEVYYWLWRWTGSTWEDMQLPHPSPAPIVSGHTFAVGSPGNEKNNYGNIVQDIFQPQDIVFCHHDGPSETPAIMHGFTFAGQPSGDDLGGWWYAECDGVGNWHNEMFLIEATDFGKDYPQRFASATSNFDGNASIPYLGGWSQGMNMDIYQGRPMFVTRKGYFGSGSDCVYVAQINSAGDAWELVGQRFPTDVYSPDISGYQWSDFGEPGCVVGGTIACFWEDESASAGYSSYFIATLFLGGNVSMNWRSSDRRGSANRVLVGQK